MTERILKTLHEECYFSSSQQWQMVMDMALAIGWWPNRERDGVYLSNNGHQWAVESSQCADGLYRSGFISDREIHGRYVGEGYYLNDSDAASLARVLQQFYCMADFVADVAADRYLPPDPDDDWTPLTELENFQEKVAEIWDGFNDRTLEGWYHITCLFRPVVSELMHKSDQLKIWGPCLTGILARFSDVFILDLIKSTIEVCEGGAFVIDIEPDEDFDVDEDADEEEEAE